MVSGQVYTESVGGESWRPAVGGRDGGESSAPRCCVSAQTCRVCPTSNPSLFSRRGLCSSCREAGGLLRRPNSKLTVGRRVVGGCQGQGIMPSREWFACRTVCTAVAGVSFSSIQLGLKCCRESVVSGSKFNLAIRGSEKSMPANPGLVCRVALQTMRRKGQGPPKMGFLRECCNWEWKMNAGKGMTKEG